MENEKEKALALVEKWHRRYEHLIDNNTYPDNEPLCDYCIGKADDCQSTRAYARCKSCLFCPVCFAMIRTKADWENKTITTEEAQVCNKKALDLMDQIYRENYDESS